MHAIAGIDDGHGHIACQKVRRAAIGMPHHDHIGADAFHRPAGIDQRFAFLDARRSRGDQRRDRASALAANSKEVRVRVEAS